MKLRFTKGKGLEKMEEKGLEKSKGGAGGKDPLPKGGSK